jgi:hypothetical protein
MFIIISNVKISTYQDQGEPLSFGKTIIQSPKLEFPEGVLKRQNLKNPLNPPF